MTIKTPSGVGRSLASANLPTPAPIGLWRLPEFPITTPSLSEPQSDHFPRASTKLRRSAR